HPWRRVTDAGDVLVDLAPRQLAPLARLGTLRNLDLQLIGVGQIPDRHAKAPRGDLLDRRTLRVAAGKGLETLGIFAPFAGVALAADAVHGHGQRFVRFGRNRAEAHRAGAEPLDDLAGRLDLIERNRP